MSHASLIEAHAHYQMCMFHMASILTVCYNSQHQPEELMSQLWQLAELAEQIASDALFMLQVTEADHDLMCVACATRRRN